MDKHNQRVTGENCWANFKLVHFLWLVFILSRWLLLLLSQHTALLHLALIYFCVNNTAHTGHSLSLAHSSLNRFETVACRLHMCFSDRLHPQSGVTWPWLFRQRPVVPLGSKSSPPTRVKKKVKRPWIHTCAQGVLLQQVRWFPDVYVEIQWQTWRCPQGVWWSKCTPLKMKQNLRNVMIDEPVQCFWGTGRPWLTSFWIDLKKEHLRLRTY